MLPHDFLFIECRQDLRSKHDKFFLYEKDVLHILCPYDFANLTETVDEGFHNF